MLIVEFQFKAGPFACFMRVGYDSSGYHVFMLVIVLCDMTVQHLHVFGLFVKQGVDIENVFSVGVFSVLIEFRSCLVFVVTDQFDGLVIEGCSEFGCRQRIAHGGAYVETANEQVACCNGHTYQSAQTSCFASNQLQAVACAAVWTDAGREVVRSVTASG